MRVLLVTHRYPPDGVGGIERYVESLRAELITAGDDVSVLTRTPTHWPRRPVLRHDNGVFRIVGSGVRFDAPWTHGPRLESLLARVLAKSTPDVVYVNQLIGLSPRTVEIAGAYGAPVVVTLHDYYFACPLAHLRKFSGEQCAGP